MTFGPFELDLSSGELRKGGTRVLLQEQPFRLLTTLLERPGEVVSRDELRSRLWSSGTFVDFEHGLNAAVRRLRRALNDSADSPVFVETLHRRGYRFIAPPAVSHRATAGPAHGPRLRLAVRRFRVVSESDRPTCFAEGLLAETIAQLVRLSSPSVGIVARGDDGVDYMLEGALRFSSGRVRITAQLIDCADDALAWADVFDREHATDALLVQQDVALLIARAVSGCLLALGGDRALQPAV
jgi:DNA-binding winged helix-turn-helix (wHTH) protein